MDCRDHGLDVALCGLQAVAPGREKIFLCGADIGIHNCWTDHFTYCVGNVQPISDPMDYWGLLLGFPGLLPCFKKAAFGSGNFFYRLPGDVCSGAGMDDKTSEKIYGTGEKRGFCY